MNDLKELAKQLYFEDVKVERYRNDFLIRLDKSQSVSDKRAEGFYCIDCGKFHKESIAFERFNKVVFPRSTGEIWIVNVHYDGCWGWD